MDTKSKGDIGEQTAKLYALKMGWGVLEPIGDRLPYDLVFDIKGKLAKVQVKYAWYDNNKKNFVIDARRTKTNRRVMRREFYKFGDFDFAIIYIEPLNVFYIFPFTEFAKYSGPIHLVEAVTRQRKAFSKRFRNAWNLIQEWALPGETQVSFSVKVGEACDVVIPNQACENRKV